MINTMVLANLGFEGRIGKRKLRNAGKRARGKEPQLTELMVREQKAPDVGFNRGAPVGGRLAGRRAAWRRPCSLITT